MQAPYTGDALQYIIRRYYTKNIASERHDLLLPQKYRLVDEAKRATCLHTLLVRLSFTVIVDSLNRFSVVPKISLAKYFSPKKEIDIMHGSASEFYAPKVSSM